MCSKQAQPGHEYTKSNVKFLTTILQNEAVKNLQSFAENNRETQGKFTIGDEKVVPILMNDKEMQLWLIND